MRRTVALVKNYNAAPPPSPPRSGRAHLRRRSTAHSAGREPRDRLLQLLRRLVLGGAEVLRLEADELLVLV